MKDSSILAGIVGNNLLAGEVLLNIKGQPIKGVKYPCRHCGQQFSQKGSLVKHQRAIHEEVKYPSSQCGKQFSQKGHLKRHIESVHKGKKPFKCHVCMAAFIQKGCLNRHIESVHEGKKPYKSHLCDAC